MNQPKVVQTPVLDVAYTESGPADGVPVLLLHGFPYDVHAYRGAAGWWPPPGAARGRGGSATRQRRGPGSRRHWARTSATCWTR